MVKSSVHVSGVAQARSAGRMHIVRCGV
jgi:hypothetical protein